MKSLSWLVAKPMKLCRVVLYAARKFYWDDLFSRASSLAYTTLFALVPVTALSFSMFRAFKMDPDRITQTVMGALQQLFPPTVNNEQLTYSRKQVLEYIIAFGDNVSALNPISLAILFCSAIALINTIESALNVVWRVSSDTSLVSKVINFWAVVTGVPLLVSLSLFWVSARAETWLHGSFLALAIPFLASWFGLSLIYFKLPSTKVRYKDAALGAFMAALLFEAAKYAFAAYIQNTSAYSVIYGALTTIPIFLFWIYIAWVVILFGAELSYQAGSIDLLWGLRKYSSDLGEIGAILGLRILYSITQAFLSGRPSPSESQLALETGADPVRVRSCLDILTEAEIISVSHPRLHSRSLLLSPEKLTVLDVVNTFRSEDHRLSFAASDAAKVLGAQRSVESSFLEILQKASQRLPSNREISSWTLKELIQESDEQHHR